MHPLHTHHTTHTPELLISTEGPGVPAMSSLENERPMGLVRRDGRPCVCPAPLTAVKYGKQLNPKCGIGFRVETADKAQRDDGCTHHGILATIKGNIPD